MLPVPPRTKQRTPNPPPPPEAKDLGRQIARIRKDPKRDLTQEQVAELADMDRAYYAGVEAGLRNPSFRQLLRIARALKVPLADLFTGIK
jgi:transcriptional regulator with XRE-family HTH domain